MNARTIEVYDYTATVREDIKNVILDNHLADYCKNAKELENLVGNEYLDCDDISGMESDSYFCNSAEARAAVGTNLELLAESLEEMGYSADGYRKCVMDPEYADTIIRLYVAGNNIRSVVDELVKEGKIRF